MKQAQSWHYPPVRHDFCVGEGVKDVLDAAGETGGLIRRDVGVDGDDDAKVSVYDDYDIHLQQPWPLDEKVQFLKEAEIAPGKILRPHIFKHELLQNFSFHLFAKRPVEAIEDMASFGRSLGNCTGRCQLGIQGRGRRIEIE